MNQRPAEPRFRIGDCGELSFLGVVNEAESSDLRNYLCATDGRQPAGIIPLLKSLQRSARRMMKSEPVPVVVPRFILDQISEMARRRKSGTG